MDYESFVKATIAFFELPMEKRVSEIKALTSDDRKELSEMLNTVPGFSHPPYAPKEA